MVELKTFKRVYEASMDGIIISDATRPDMPIVYCNPAFLKLTGYPKDEVLGRNCRFLQNGETGQQGLTKIRRALNDGTSCRVVLRNYRKDGELFFNYLSIFPLHNDKGELTHFIGVQHDVTEMKRTEVQLSHALSQQRKLLQEVHHRIKNNMALISGLLYLESMHVEEDAARQPLENSIRRIKSMSLIHEQLMDLSKFTVIERFDLHLQKLVGEILNSLAAESVTVNPEWYLEAVSMNVNQAVTLTLLVNEVMTDLFSGTDGAKTVELNIQLEEDENVVSLLVSAEEIPGPGAAGSSLSCPTRGMLINTLARQLDAEVETIDAGKRGYSIRFEKEETRGSSSAMQEYSDAMLMELDPA